MLVVVPYTSCRGAMEILPQHFGRARLEHFKSRSMTGLTTPAAVFLAAVPSAPLATLFRARARLLPREPTLPRSAALPSQGSSRLSGRAGHNTPLQPATLPPRG